MICPSCGVGFHPEWKDLSPEEAQKKIDDGGDQSPDAVSKRILDFVKGFSDGTPGRSQLLRDAVEKGFHDAEGEFGCSIVFGSVA